MLIATEWACHQYTEFDNKFINFIIIVIIIIIIIVIIIIIIIITWLLRPADVRGVPSVPVRTPNYGGTTETNETIKRLFFCTIQNNSMTEYQNTRSICYNNWPSIT